MSSEYSSHKLASHPLVLDQMRRTGEGRLLSVHLMPQNLCNHRCSFCSYRLPENKNSEAFNEAAHIPIQWLNALLDDLESMGVLGIEVTGGGEPLAYPWQHELWSGMARRGFATALVTNGTLLKDAALVTQSMKWARVSIDAGTPATYAETRGCPESHFERAWGAVAAMREAAPDDPDFRLGVGFVLSNENLGEILPFVRRARDSGADNVRLSSTFSDKHLDYYKDQGRLAAAVEDARRAKVDFETDDFHVHDFVSTRLWETAHPEQDYRRCPTKDLLCVVEGECRVYTCCTFTGSLSGLYGRFDEHPDGFRGLWEGAAQWRRDFDASTYCKCSCLYRDKNMAMNELIEGHLHREFV